MFKVTEVLAQYSIGQIQKVKALTAGLIHQTFYIESDLNQESTAWILQQLHPKLSTLEIRTDYEHVTQYLSNAGYAGPKIVCTIDQSYYAQDQKGTYWRLITYVPGNTYESVDRLELVELGAKALAQFHTIIQDFPHPILSKHLGHNTTAHLNALQQVAADPQYAQEWLIIKEVAEKIIEELPTCLLPSEIPRSIVHGDPKISNIRFQNDTAIMIDLDTCNVHSRLVDLGDAIRSWCYIEDAEEGDKFSIERYKTLITAYREYAPSFTELELEYLPSCGRLITLELASRFAKDYLEDYYFGFDQSKFASRKVHNKHAMHEMYSLAQEMKQAENQLKEWLTK